MAVITISYKELLRIGIELPFYANGRSRKGAAAPVPDISITPDAETEALFRRMDLLLRTVPGGVVILARTQGETAGGDPLMRFPARKGDKITLLLQLNNPGVLAVNDLPADAAPEKLIYLSNTVADADAARDKLHLSESADGVSGGSDTVSFAKDTYRFHSSTLVNPASVFVKHLLTGEEVPPASLVNEGGKADLLFNLSSLPGGLCELWIGGALKESFYHLAGSSPQPVFGVIEILLDSTPDENYRVIEPDRSLSAPRPHFTAGFVSRETRWRYTFALQSSGPLALELAGLSAAQKTAFLAHLNIVTNDSSLSFSPHPSGSDDRLVFVADAPVALREGYFTPGGAALSLALRKSIGEAGEAVVKRGLPYPSASIITPEGTDTYSDIFITL